MNGAREYANLFETGQYGRLYIVSGTHARGNTFYIYVLPPGEKAKPNGPMNGPLNSCVEVYGVVDGIPGWTESYGWLHAGPWQADFAKLVASKRLEIAEKERRFNTSTAEAAAAEQARQKQLLDSYVEGDGLGSAP